MALMAAHRFAGIVLLTVVCAIGSGIAQAPAPKQRHSGIRAYIASAWDTLTRRMDRCSAIIDPKLPAGQSRLYLPAGMAIPERVAALGRQCRVRIENLPAPIKGPSEVDTSSIRPGLLYLPNPYVVPGGRFNEMYGWDSYFIILGLLEDGRVDLARGMVENFFFELEHYGAVLNANRTYYLTRSQPPFLTSMILAVWEADKQTRSDRAWLERAYAAANKDYQFWTTGAHLAGKTGLSRYYDFGSGPVPEETPTYGQVARWLMGRLNTEFFEPTSASDASRSTPAWSVQLCSATAGKDARKACQNVTTVALKVDYYKGDRSMRESGFDISFRFGPFGARTHHFAPVCLNSLLYKTEMDMQRIASELGLNADAQTWAKRAETRKQGMQQLFWDAQRGQFFDWNHVTNSRSTYEFASTFYPLWTGWATPEQAAAVARSTSAFIQPGGLATSRTTSGVQWDFPYGWAPLQLIAVEGLRRYGQGQQAKQIVDAWLSMVRENYEREGTIREKYNVVTRSPETRLTAGYEQNVVGFGWTNGVVLRLLKLEGGTQTPK